MWLRTAKKTTAETAADALIDWCVAIGVVRQWVSDRGSHFKNESVRLLKERTHSAHHFTLANCPWSTGTVEVVRRELSRATRVLLSEYQLLHKCWPSIVPVVQPALINSNLECLGNHCPLTVLTGHPQDSPLTSITCKVVMKVEG